MEEPSNLGSNTYQLQLVNTLYITHFYHHVLPHHKPQAKEPADSALQPLLNHETKTTFHGCKWITSDASYSNGSWYTQNFDVLQNISQWLTVKYSQEMWISDSSKINPGTITHSFSQGIHQSGKQKSHYEQPLCFRKRPVIALCTDFLVSPRAFLCSKFMNVPRRLGGTAKLEDSPSSRDHTPCFRQLVLSAMVPSSTSPGVMGGEMSTVYTLPTS